MPGPGTRHHEVGRLLVDELEQLFFGCCLWQLPVRDVVRRDVVVGNEIVEVTMVGGHFRTAQQESVRMSSGWPVSGTDEMCVSLVEEAEAAGYQSIANG